MPVYMGENGVVRRANNLYVGVDGVTRSILQGFNAVGSARRQFFGRLDDINYVELRLSEIDVQSVNSSGDYTGQVGNTLTVANQYGDISISGLTFRVTCNTIGKGINLRGRFNAYFQDGREYDLSNLTSWNLKYGASVSFAVSWVFSFTRSSSGSGAWHGDGHWAVNCCGGAPDVDHVDTYGSGTFYPNISDNDFWLYSAIDTSNVSITTYSEMTLPSYITIDGHSIPLVVSNQLT